MECWTDDQLLKLVRLYSRFPNLWDHNEPSYDDLPSRYYSYSRILQHVTVSDVLSQLRKLRRIYVSELRRMDVALKSGRICQPGVVWFEVMHRFLYDHLDADERLARSSNISIHSRGSSSHSWPTCSSQGASQCCEKEEKAEIFQENSSDQRRAQKGHIFFLRAPTTLPLARMNTVYEITKRKGTNLDSEKKSDDNSKCIQCKVFCEEPNIQGKKRRHVACPGTLRIRCKDKFHVDNLDKDQLSSRVSCSKDDGRPYHEMSRTVCRNEGPSKCRSCEEREKNIQMNKVIESCISAARKSLSNIRQQRPELDEHLISRTLQKKDSAEKDEDVQNSSCVSRSRHENTKNVVKCPKEETKVICLGDDMEDHLSTILNDTTIKLCPVDIICNSDASRWSSCKSCSEPTKSVKLPIFAKKGNADSLQEVLEMARIELQDAGTLYNDNSKLIRGSRDGLQVAEEINKEYDWFGTEVATALKKTDRQRAIKLKELILETLHTTESREVDNASELKYNALSNVNSKKIRISAELKEPRYSSESINPIQELETENRVPVLDSLRDIPNSEEQLGDDLNPLTKNTT
ncbi:uncharacterized protein LOC112494023 isoform X2 [Cephus cinctus]|uniref:Uncharacterized protein LOC112494023 isoform X2 n=1 Tax=Cephus cinctus TaxID=211228 RepID=A0AAJ7RDM5_CEPCN|nr:uncharacterized protein LOC112494023 isoform X2 [Cephus cinctus]